LLLKLKGGKACRFPGQGLPQEPGGIGTNNSIRLIYKNIYDLAQVMQ